MSTNNGEITERAKVLTEALPYIKKFRGRRMVIKLGGAVLDNPDLKERIIGDIVLLHFVGMLPIIVHGGGQQISRMMEKLGKRSSFLQGKRVTDGETMEIAQMVLAGMVNKNIVSHISNLGSEAVGLSGQDGRLIEAKKAEELKEGSLGLVGHVQRINISYLERLYSQQIIPVISPIATERSGQALNVNADEVATEIACALCVERLIFVSDVDGVMAQTQNPQNKAESNHPANIKHEGGEGEKLLSEIHIAAIDNLIQTRKVAGGMAVKLLAAKKAIEEGVRGVQIVSGIKAHSLLIELFSDAGVGTKII